MADREEASGDGVSEQLLELLRDAGGGSSFVDEILDTPGVYEGYGGVDGRASLIAIMRCLVVLTGSEAGAVSWLFHSRGAPRSREVMHISPWRMATWSLTVLEDWLQILVTYRGSCPLLIDAIFHEPAS